MGRQRHVADVLDLVAVADDGAHLVVGGWGGRLDERQVRVCDGVNGGGCFARRNRAVGGSRLIGHLAGVQVGLADRVAGGAGDARPRRQAGRRRRTDLVGRPVVRHRERSAERNVAAVGQQVAVVDDVTDRFVGGWAGGLHEGQGRRLNRGHRLVVGVGVDRVAAEEALSLRGVLDRAGVQVSLADSIAGRAGNTRGRRQAGRRRAGHGCLVVGHCERSAEGDGVIIGQQVAVVDDDTDCAVGGWAGGLDERQFRLDHGHVIRRIESRLGDAGRVAVIQLRRVVQHDPVLVAADVCHRRAERDLRGAGRHHRISKVPNQCHGRTAIVGRAYAECRRRRDAAAHGGVAIVDQSLWQHIRHRQPADRPQRAGDRQHIVDHISDHHLRRAAIRLGKRRRGHGEGRRRRVLRAIDRVAGRVIVDSFTRDRPVQAAPIRIHRVCVRTVHIQAVLRRRRVLAHDRLPHRDVPAPRWASFKRHHVPHRRGRRGHGRSVELAIHQRREVDPLRQRILRRHVVGSAGTRVGKRDRVVQHRPGRHRSCRRHCLRSRNARLAHGDRRRGGVVDCRHARFGVSVTDRRVVGERCADLVAYHVEDTRLELHQEDVIGGHIVTRGRGVAAEGDRHVAAVATGRSDSVSRQRPVEVRSQQTAAANRRGDHLDAAGDVAQSGRQVVEHDQTLCRALGQGHPGCCS